MESNSTSSILRWGIIGTGDVAERKGGPALYLAERSELVAVMNRTRSRADEFARRHRAPRVHDTVESLLADKRVNAVYVATHPHTHARLTEQAARAGKHVLCEKPMAMSVAEAEGMIEACREHGVSLSIAFYRREFPVVRKLKELLNAGAIGRALSVHLDNYTPFSSAEDQPWRLDRLRSGGGMLMDIGSHRFDLMAYLFGMPQAACGFTAAQHLSQDVEDAAAVAFRFEEGVLGSANFQWNTPVARDDMTVVGTEGVLSIHDLSGRAELSLKRAEGAELWTLPAPEPVHLPLVQRIVDHVLDQTANPCSGEDGVLASRMIEQVLV